MGRPRRCLYECERSFTLEHERERSFTLEAPRNAALGADYGASDRRR